ncbi:DUF2057 domain-containing protein [Thalassomonas viridans]|uniref:DUF2057 domain-containing protein n=1 Tax=Thalassomonas viridans TaxID=137584 RepID=A0AAE9Z9M4_9GAMM|nr:DUF2057 family protein [Thalassomonas viridans]WDE07637.1 DUF2057 domain-containing protein [Thalassomonas viridans]
MRLSFLFLLFFSGTVFAGNLQLPKEITVVSINGQPYQNSFFASDSDIQLAPGQQLLVLEYKDIFENYEDDDHTTIRSEPFVVIFNVGEQDKLKLKLPEIAGEQQARDFANKFNVSFLDASNREHPVFIQDLMKYKAGLMTTHPVLQSTPVIAGKPAEAELEQDENALNQLKHWWQLASEKQKRHFMQYLLLQQQIESAAQGEEVKK